MLNTLYGTNVIAIYKAAGILEKLLKETPTTGPLLVEELVDGIKKVKSRAHHTSSQNPATFSSIQISQSWTATQRRWPSGTSGVPDPGIQSATPGSAKTSKR